MSGSWRIRRRPESFLFLLLCLLLPGLPPLAACHADGEALASPVRHLDYWQEALGRPLGQRTGIGSQALADYVNLDNRRNGLPAHSAPASSGVLASEIQAVLEGLPEVIQERLASKLAGVYLIDHLGSTGFTETVQDAQGRPVAGFVVLDPGALVGRGANAWASWKESTPFLPAAGYRLEMTLENPADDGPRQALQYILLHEIGHVLAIGSGLAPDWNLAPACAGKVDDYDFSRLSWQLDAGGLRWRYRAEAEFPLRTQLRYYREGALDAAQMAEAYRQLQASNFATLYAATNPADDFAEAFASYVHVVLLHKPFHVSIYHQGRLQRRYEACWGQPRCAAKQALLAALLDVN